MNIDCVAQNIAITKDTVLTIAAVVAAYVALKGLSTWNRQLKGGVEYELTRRILKCAYRLREAIKGVRNPVMWGNEMPTPTESEAANMSNPEIRHYGIAKAYQKRWDKVTEVRTDLQTEMLEAEAIWGRVIYDKFEPIFKLQQELYSSVHAYVSACNPNESEQSRTVYQEIMRKQRDILYDQTQENPDEFTQDINSVIQEIESFLKPHLRK
jgi:hypothetical protein